jgi:hypothetical protein
MSTKLAIVGMAATSAALVSYINNDDYANVARVNRINWLKNNSTVSENEVNEIHDDFKKITEWREQPWYVRTIYKPEISATKD